MVYFSNNPGIFYMSKKLNQLDRIDKPLPSSAANKFSEYMRNDIISLLITNVLDFKVWQTNFEFLTFFS